MFESATFWAALAATGGLLQLVSPQRAQARAALVATISVLVLWLAVRLPLVKIALILACVAWIPVGLALTRSISSRRPASAALLTFLPILGCWSGGKLVGGTSDPAENLFLVVGFSFLLVKSWTTIKDHHDGKLAAVDPVMLAAFLLHFPTWVAGPMHRYEDFAKTLREPKPLNGLAILDVVLRLLIGFAKIRVLVPLIRPLGLDAMTHGAPVSVGPLAAASVVYSVVIWADFSGYTDLAIATARLLGFETPENFRRPYAAVNVRDFWQRWHMTFSQALTSYLFVPIARWLPRVLGDRPRSVMIVATTITFLFCGAWHGPTSNFLLWGLYHAAGLIAYDLYRPWATRRRLKRRAARSPLGKGIARAVATAATFAFVSAGWILFVLEVPDLQRVLGW